MRSLCLIITLFITLLLSACQNHSPFTRAQQQAMQQQGFRNLGDRWELGLNDKILFGIDQSSVTPTSQRTIANISTRLAETGITHVAINGHTDNYGEANYNQQLSLKRAQRVANAWINNGHQSTSHVTVHGYGMREPIASNKTAAGRAQNRRVAIVIEAP